MAIISVESLSKSFDYYKKEVGLKSSINNIFHREKLVKEAVRHISFEIEEGICGRFSVRRKLPPLEWSG